MIGSIPLRGWCDEQLVKLTALVATRATRSLCSASKLLSFVYEVDMKPTLCVTATVEACYFEEVAIVIFWWSVCGDNK